MFSAVSALFLGFVATLLIGFSALAEVRSYDIKGMTCQSCVKAVKAKVCQLPGISKCEVSINKVTITGEKLDDEVIKTVVSKAGDYKVIGVEHADAAHGTAIKPQPGPTLTPTETKPAEIKPAKKAKTN